MKEKVLSVFIDESGDFGQYNPASPNYYVAMVLHNQEMDISKNIEALERQVSNWGYPEHTIHTGPLIRRESVYKNDLREQRKALFNALYHFTRLLDIQYICPVINQGDCAEKSKLAYTDKLTKRLQISFGQRIHIFHPLIKLLFTMTMDRLSWPRFLCLCLILCFQRWNLEK